MQYPNQFPQQNGRFPLPNLNRTMSPVRQINQFGTQQPQQVQYRNSPNGNGYQQQPPWGTLKTQTIHPMPDQSSASIIPSDSIRSSPPVKNAFRPQFQYNSPPVIKTIYPVQNPWQPPGFDQVSGVHSVTQTLRSNSTSRYTTTQSTVPQPSVARIEQPLQVIDLRQYEEMWHERIKSLEAALKKPEVIYSDDTQKVNGLQEQLESANNENGNLQSSLEESQRGQREAEAALQSALDNLEAYKRKNADLEQQLKNKTNENAHLYADLQHADLENQDLRAKLQKALQNQGGNSSQIDLLNKQIITLQGEVQSYKVQWQTVTTQYTTLQTQFTALQGQWRTLTQENESYKIQITTFQSQLKSLTQENESLKTQLTKLKIDYQNSLLDLQSSKSQISTLQIQLQGLQQLQSQIQQLKLDLENSRTDNQGLRVQIASLQQTVTTQLRTIEGLKSENLALQSDLQAFQDQLKEKDQIISDLDYEIEQMKLEMETTTESTTSKFMEDALQWKTKYRELTNTYHELQEKFMLTEAQLEVIQKTKITQQVQVTETRKSQQVSSQQLSSSQHMSSEKRSGSQYEQVNVDAEQLKRLQF